MRSFLNSVRSDLLDRRFLPVLAILGVALLAALAFAVLGGGSSPSTTPPATSASSGATGAVGTVAITPAPAANKAVAETTSGAHQPSKTPRNPFTPLSTPKAKSASASSSASAPASGSGSSSGGSSSPSGSSTGSGQPSTKTEPAPKPSTPTKRVYIHYHVSAEFGLLPAAVEGAPPQAPQLKTYPNMALDEPLPSKDNPQLVFLGVVLSTGKDAVFALTGEAILHGNATCKPSAAQCQAIQLPVGQTETLEVIEADGQPATYELKLLSIAKSLSKASAAKAHAASEATSKAGRRLLSQNGMPTLSELHYAPKQGGLVPVVRRSFAAHAASHRR